MAASLEEALNSLPDDSGGGVVAPPQPIDQPIPAGGVNSGLDRALATIPGDDPVAPSLQDSFQAIPVNDPDQAAKIMGLASQAGADEHFVEANLSAVQAAASAPKPGQLKEITERHPELAAFLSNPRNMSVSHDDLENLSAHSLIAQNANSVLPMLVDPVARERYVQSLMRGAGESAVKIIRSSYESGVLSQEQGIINWNRMVGQSRPGDDARLEYVNSRILELEPSLPKMEALADVPAFALSGSAQMAPLLAGAAAEGVKYGVPLGLAAAAAGPAAPLAIPAAYGIGALGGAAWYNFKVFAGQAYQSYGQLRDKQGQPIADDILKTTALLSGAVQAGFGMLPINAILKSIPGSQKFLQSFLAKAAPAALEKLSAGKALATFAKTWIPHTLQGAAGMAGMTATALTGAEVAKAASGQPFEAAPAGAIVSETSRGFLEAIPVMALMGAPGRVGRLAFDLNRLGAQAQRADAAEKLYRTMGDSADKSKLLPRMPASYQDYVSQLTKDGPVESVYIPAAAFKSYAESKQVDPAVLASDLGITQLYQAAQSAGGDIQIPMAQWIANSHSVSKATGNLIYQDFARDIKFSPDDLTQRQKDDQAIYYQEQFEAETKKAVDTNPGWAEIKDTIAKEKQAELESAGMAPKEAKASAELFASMATATAARVKGTPDQVARDMVSQIVGVENLQIAPGAMSQTEGMAVLDRAIKERMPASIEAEAVRPILAAAGARETDMKAVGLDKFLQGKKTVSKADLLDLVPPQGEGYLLDRFKNLFQATPAASIFYSKAERAITDKMPNSAPADSIKGLLAGAGVKEEEIEWLGLDDFLAGKQKVSKQEMLDFIRTNNVQIREVEKGQNKPHKLSAEEYDSLIRQRDHLADGIVRRGETVFTTTPELRSRLDSLNEKIRQNIENDETKFSSYQLPGGQNYRELLLTLPERIDKDKIAKRLSEIANMTQEEKKKNPGVDDEFYGLVKQRDGESLNQFRSSHFDEPNILAHVRFNDRVDAEGKKVLFLEEVQSDWHQKGREQGYKDRTKEYRIEKQNDGWQVIGPDGQKIGFAHKSEEKANRYLEQTMNLTGHEDRIPNTPFKKTWHELALKRMVRYAAENGYDRIAWTTGEQQAGRYNLSKQVEKVIAKKTDDGKFEIAMILPGSRIHWAGTFSPSELPNVVGKDLAEKIASQTDMDHRYSGLDLKVGGEGMKGFYDKILPYYANKLGKRFGARVGETSITTGNPKSDLYITPDDLNAAETSYQVWDKAYDAQPLDSFPSREQAQAFIDKAEPVEPVDEKVHSLDITPAMRESAMSEGFPLFQAAPNAKPVVTEPRTDYSRDIFNEPAAPRPRNPKEPFRNDAPGTYATRTAIVKEGTRQIGVGKVNTPEEAAQAMAYLAKNAVEHMDALITDAKGKPLAIIGGFKGTVDQTMIFPATIVAEAFRIKGAANIWFAHNHPSGSAKPSASDLELNKALSNSFRGSEIQAHGIFVIGGSKGEGRVWEFEPSVEMAGKYTTREGVTGAAQKGASVPVVERVFADEKKLWPVLNNVQEGLRMAGAFSDNKSGLIIMDSKHNPVAFVPVDAAEAGILRTKGRMDALYRALSISNASAAIIVNNGSMGDEVVRNLAGFLSNNGTRVLDVIGTGTEAVKSWAAEGRGFQGKSFFQAAQGAFDKNTRKVTLSFKAANASTFMHEAAHGWLTAVADYVKQGRADAGLQADWKEITSWLGGKEGEALTVDQHEKFASTFEAYLREGQAPTRELEGVFARFRRWLVEIYKSVSDIGAGRAEISPEVRGIMSRMVASEEEIKAATADMALEKELDIQGIDPGVRKQLVTMRAQAHDQAVAMVMKEQMKELAAGAQADSAKVIAKMTAEEEEKLKTKPLYVAGAQIKEYFGMDAKKAAQKFLSGEFASASGGRDDLAFENFAENNNFYSGEDMAKQLIASRGLKEESLARAGARSAALYPDLMNSEQMHAAALDAVHNERQLEILILEREALKKILAKRGGLAPAEATRLRGAAEKAVLKDLPQPLSPAEEDQMAADIKQIAIDARREIENQPEYLATSELIKRLGPKYREIARKYYERKEFTPKQDQAFNDVAGNHDFPGPEEAARVIADLPKKADVIKELVEAQIEAKYGLKQFDEQAYNKALAEMGTEISSVETKALVSLFAKRRQAAIDRVRMEADIAKAKAAEILANTLVRDVETGTVFFTAERNAAVKVAQAVARGDYDAAVAAKQEQLLNHTLALGMRKLQAQAEEALATIGDIAGRRKESMKDQQTFDQVAELLQRFGLGHRMDYDRLARTESLMAYVQRMAGLFAADLNNADASPLSIADWIMVEGTPMNYRMLTMDRLIDIKNALKNILHVANMADRLYTMSENFDLSGLVTQLATAADVNVHANISPKILKAQGERGKGNLASYFYSMRRLDTILQQLDGGRDRGAWRNAFEMPTRAAADNESKLMRDSAEKLIKIWSAYEQKDIDEIFKKKLMIKEFGATAENPITKAELLAMALNLGNTGNRDRLFNTPPVGFKPDWDWGLAPPEQTEKNVMEVLGRYLNRRDWQFVQNIWDHINQYWPKIAELHESMTGFAPGKVEPVPFEVALPDGSMMQLKGGYYPLGVDPRYNERAAEREISADALYTDLNPAYKAVTKTGHTKARTGAMYAVTFDLSLIDRHLRDIIHDLAFRPLVYDLRRLSARRQFVDAVKRNLGEEGYRLIQNWIKSVATGSSAERMAMDVLSRVVRRLNKSVTAALVLGKAGVILQNFANPFLSIGRVEGWGWMDMTKAMLGRGLMDYWLKATFNHPEARKMQDFVWSRSQFMRDRRSIPEWTLKELKNNSKTGKKGLWDFMIGLLGGSDDMTNIPHWIEAYTKELNSSHNEQEAAEYADKLINRMTGSGRKYDVAKILRGTDMETLFTKLYSFWNVEYNNWILEAQKLKSPTIRNVPRFVGFVASRLMFVYASAVLAGQLPRQDDEESSSHFWIKSLVSYGTSFFPFAREIAGAALDRILGLRSYGYRPAPILSLGEQILKSVSAGKKAAAEGDIFAGTIEPSMMALFLLKGWPTQFHSWFWNAYDALKGDMELEPRDFYRRRPTKERQ